MPPPHPAKKQASELNIRKGIKLRKNIFTSGSPKDKPALKLNRADEINTRPNLFTHMSLCFFRKPGLKTKHLRGNKFPEWFISLSEFRFFFDQKAVLKLNISKDINPSGDIFIRPSLCFFFENRF